MAPRRTRPALLVIVASSDTGPENRHERHDLELGDALAGLKAEEKP